MAEEKAFKPSKKKLEKARKDGKVLKSPILAQSFAFLGSILCLDYLLSSSWVRNKLLVEYSLISGISDPFKVFTGAMNFGFVFVLVCLLATAVISIFAVSFQVGLRFEPSVLAPKASRLDIGGGFKRIFKGLKEVWQMLLRLFILLLLFACFLVIFRNNLPALIFSPITPKISLTGEILFRFLLWGSVVLLLFGALDYFFKRRDFLKELSMSHDEMRKEYKNSEGDPLIKSQRRAEHEALAMRDLVTRLRKSRVVVVERN